jgi:hypothetical protein
MKNGYDATKHATMIRMYRDERNMPFSATAVGRVDRRARYPGRSRSEAGLAKSACFHAMLLCTYTHQAQEEHAESHEPQRPGKTPDCDEFLHQLGRFSTQPFVGLWTDQRPHRPSQTRPTGCDAGRKPPLLHEELAWNGVRCLRLVSRRQATRSSQDRQAIH